MDRTCVSDGTKPCSTPHKANHRFDQPIHFKQMTRTLVAWKMTVADLWNSLELIFRWPYCLFALLPFGRVRLLSSMCCAHKPNVVFPMNIALASDMSSMQELILVFVAKSHVWTQRIFLVYAIDTGCIMNLGPANLSRHQLASSRDQERHIGIVLLECIVYAPNKNRLGVELSVSCCLICQSHKLAQSVLVFRDHALIEIIFHHVDRRHVCLDGLSNGVCRCGGNTLKL